MPIGTPAGNLDIKNATLRTSNLETQNIKIGSIFVGTGNSLEETANVGNSMSNTIQFTNTHTAFTTTGNVSVGKDLTVTGNVTVDTNTLHVDATNNRVGVGTTNPNVLLELSSDTGSATIVPTELRLSSSTNATDWDTTNPYARLAFYTEDVTADAPGVMASIGAVASSVDGGENTRLAFFTAEPHVERMCIDRYGNVGIGTTSPQYELDVNTGSDIMLRLMAIAGSTGKLILGRSGDKDLRSHAIEVTNNSGSQNNSMKFLIHDGTGISPYETRTEVMTLVGNGRVGIRTASPSFPLSVSDASVKQWNAFDNNTSAGDYTFTKSGIYLVGFMYGDGSDGNVCEYYTITAATSHGGDCGVTQHKNSGYLNYAVQDHDTVRFWSGSPSNALPAGFNSSNFHLRIYFAGYF